MLIVDTHCHVSPYWFEPIEVLLVQMDRNGVDKATLIQAKGERDNSYIIECARRFPGRFSPVVIVDHERTDALDILMQWVKQGAEGIRLRATERSPGKDPLAIWRTCSELKLPVSCSGREDDFGSVEFSQLVQALPELPIVIEHLGHVGPRHGGQNEPPPYERYKNVLALAKFSNTYIKVGGLGEICERPYPFQHPFFSAHGIPPFIKMAYDSFGPSRMMWSSNYPPCSVLEGYANTLNYVVEHLGSFCSKDDMEFIMGKTALSLFPFKQGHSKGAGP